MALHYNIVKFIEPKPITEETYQKYKCILKDDKHNNVYRNQTFVERFRGQIFFAFFGSIGFLISFILERLIWKRASLLAIIIISFFVIALIFTIQLIREGPPYIDYVKKNRMYYSRLKHSIIITEGYKEFYQNFYLNISKADHNSFIEWYYDIEEKDNPVRKSSFKDFFSKNISGFFDDVSDNLGVALGIIIIIWVGFGLTYLVDYLKK